MGIYELKGDTLIFCYGTKRPTELDGNMNASLGLTAAKADQGGLHDSRGAAGSVLFRFTTPQPHDLTS